MDMLDLKPDAPAEIRGPFQPIATRVPGLQICELLPQLAGIADKFAIIRSVSHRNSNHTPMIYYTLTGRETALPDRDNDIRPPQGDDFPHTGCSRNSNVLQHRCQVTSRSRNSQFAVASAASTNAPERRCAAEAPASWARNLRRWPWTASQVLRARSLL